MAKTYSVQEIFYSLQGEGTRMGTANVFVRFAGCNLNCNREEHGFDCDTDFTSGTKMTADEILAMCAEVSGGKADWVILTGGEPTLQVDNELVKALHGNNYRVALESNGTNPVNHLGLDYVVVSPKSAWHTIRAEACDELRVVRAEGQPLPKIPTNFAVGDKMVSPAFDPDWSLSNKTLHWCIKLVKDNPDWRLSVQMHKIWGAR